MSHIPQRFDEMTVSLLKGIEKLYDDPPFVGNPESTPEVSAYEGCRSADWPAI